MNCQRLLLLMLLAFTLNACKDTKQNGVSKNQYASKACPANYNPFPLENKDARSVTVDDLPLGVYKYVNSEILFKDGSIYHSHIKHIEKSDFENPCATQIGVTEQVFANYDTKLPVAILKDKASTSFLGMQVTLAVKGSSAEIRFKELKDGETTKVFTHLRDLVDSGTDYRIYETAKDSYELRLQLRDLTNARVSFTRGDVTLDVNEMTNPVQGFLPLNLLFDVTTSLN